MKSFISLALASVSFVALGSTAVAQTSETPQAAPAEQAMLGEIVVTARRRSESLQEVPQSVTAVTSETLQKLNIQKLEDVTAVTPGLSLGSGNTGYSTVIAVRGLSFQSESAASPTVAFYLNDAPAETTMLLQSMFDVGQIEVLRGPQGTVRGLAAPSGALTVTTRKPDLGEVGGYINATVTDQHGRNVNGAVNVPIIKDVLGVRVAGLIDQNDFDGVRSIFTTARPKSATSAIRTSVSFEPNDSFNAFVTYLHMDRALNSYTQVAGPGAGFNGPAIQSGDRLSVNEDISDIHSHFDTVTANLDSRLFGQHLSYVGSYGFQKIHANFPQDAGNLIPGELFNTLITTQERTAHEFRVASDPAPGRFLDYTVGAFYQWINNQVNAQQPRALAGFFGSPVSPSPLTVNRKFQADISILSPSASEETSFFGSLTAHLGADTEITGGARYIISRNVRATNLSLKPGFTVAPGSRLPFGGGCGPFPSTYPGFCDVPVPATPIPGASKRSLDKPTIYNLSISHHFSRDLLVYATTGSSWRPGPAVVGITNGASDPVLAGLQVLDPEKSKSYEVGVKSTWLDGRARLNVALFRQKFKNLIIRGEPVQYLSSTSPADPGTPTLFNFTSQVPALVTGFDVDAAFQVTPEWNVSVAASYADGRAQNGAIPCNGPIPAGQHILICPTNSSTSRDPLWNASVSSEYVHPVADGMDGFLRGLFNYYPKNARRSSALGIDNYSLLNVYAGVRSDDGAWEVSLFAKNAFKTNKTLSRDANAFTLSGSPFPLSTTGYFGTTYTPRREVGVNVRYAFGSR